jgi:hypothetical protein
VPTLSCRFCRRAARCTGASLWITVAIRHLAAGEIAQVPYRDTSNHGLRASLAWRSDPSSPTCGCRPGRTVQIPGLISNQARYRLLCPFAMVRHWLDNGAITAGSALAGCALQVTAVSTIAPPVVTSRNPALGATGREQKRYQTFSVHLRLGCIHSARAPQPAGWQWLLFAPP